jgi:hypothetical protein
LRLRVSHRGEQKKSGNRGNTLFPESEEEMILERLKTTSLKIVYRKPVKVS